MKLIINQIRTKNFRNIVELNLDLKDITEIVAENGKGKTNTLSAMTWCLFGKDIYDVKNFTISPIIDEEERNDITTNVTLVINDNYVVSRTWYQRKTTIETGYVIDGKEELTTKTQSQFQDELKEKFDIDEETFKSLSNINYLPNLNWKDLKEYIFNLIGDVKDEEVLLRDDFSLIEEQIKLMGINDTKDSLNKSDSTLNDEIKALETEYQTKVNLKEELVANEEESKQLENRKQEIEKEIAEYQEKQKEQDEIRKKYESKQDEIIECKSLIQHKERQIEFNNNAIEDYKKSYELNSVSVDVMREKEKEYIKNKIGDIQDRLSYLDMNNYQKEDELKKVKQQGMELQGKEPKVENETCSACGQKLPEEKIKETLDNLKKIQLETLNKLQEEKISLETILINNHDEMNQKTKELEELKEELSKIDSKEYQVEEETEKQKEIRVARENKELENKNLLENIQILTIRLENYKKELEAMPQPENEFVINKELFKELDEINNKLATTITLNTLEDKVKEVDEKLKNAKEQKNVLKNKLEQVAKFNNLKAEFVRQKAKSYFKIVDFKTKTFTQDGVEQETFLIQINGIEYKELNSAMKIYVAIDLLSGIQKLKDIKVPILIDNTECLSSNIECSETQIIMTKVERNQPNLKVNYYE